MKKGFLISTLLTAMVLTSTPVQAAGSAKVEFIGSDRVNVGDTFTVYMNVKEIEDTYDGVVSLGGNISFDETKLKYISSKGAESPYLFQINEDYGYRIAGLDFTLDNGIRSNMTVYEFTFEALEEGNTSITLTNAKLTDSKEYIDTTVVSKSIAIEETTSVSNDDTDRLIVETEKEDVSESTDNTEINDTEEVETVETETQSTEEKAKDNFATKISKMINNFIKTLLNIFK